MSSKLTGSWRELKLFTQNFGADVQQESKKYMNNTSEEIKQAIQDTINLQTEPWVALKHDTVQRKGSSIKLKETGDLVNSIDVTSLGANKYVISPQGQHNSGLSNSEIALIHEYGTEKVPPRPFIQPVYEEYENEVPNDMEKIISKTIKKYI